MQRCHGRFIEITWNVYQNIIAAYRDKDRAAGRRALSKLIDQIKAGVPKALEELGQLGRTLHKRRDNILAFFDHPGTSNGPTARCTVDVRANRGEYDLN